jgi:hypothetical protein
LRALITLDNTKRDWLMAVLSARRTPSLPLLLLFSFPARQPQKLGFPVFDSTRGLILDQQKRYSQHLSMSQKGCFKYLQKYDTFPPIFHNVCTIKGPPDNSQVLSVPLG